MAFLTSILPYAQIVISVLLVASILLQTRGSSLGGAFGGSDFAGTYNKRRGAEKWLFYATIVLGILLALSAFLALLIV
ncbi:MAG: preprotein translocase subunit SecG [Candidatus Paceibacterota bacterium]